jgi:hypothetical protein
MKLYRIDHYLVYEAGIIQIIDLDTNCNVTNTLGEHLTLIYSIAGQYITRSNYRALEKIQAYLSNAQHPIIKLI